MYLIRFISIFFIAQLFVINASAQKVSIRATTDKNQILIGQPFQLTIQVSVSKKSNILFSMPDSISHFEILGKPDLDSISNNNTIGITAIYRMTSFDSGRWAIPPIVLTKNIKSDSIVMDVVFSDFDPAADYHDIKDIIEVKPKTEIRWWRYIVGGVLLLLLVGYYFIRKKKKIPVAPKEVPVNPYQLAMKQLNELQKSSTEVKQFHTRLIEIFRQYLFFKKGILSAQKTTADLVPQLKSINMSKEGLAQLAQSLQVSDMVKFAKYNATKDESDACFKQVVETINKLEQGG